MGGRVVMLDGYESGGTDFIDGDIVTPNAIVTSPVYEGTYSMQIDSSAVGSRVQYNLDLGLNLDHIIGFAFRFTDNPAVETQIFRAIGINLTIEARMNTSGEIFLESVTGTSSTYALSVDTWYYIEIVWANFDSATSYIYVDGVQRISFTSDFRTGFAGDVILMCTDPILTTDPATTFFFDNLYVKEDVVLADLIANSAGSAPFVKIAGPYNNTAEDATDQGDTLDDGTWADMSDVPTVEDSPDAGYTATAAASGHQISDEGSRSGPSGDGITDTILGAAWALVLKRSGGGATEHYGIYGHNGDVLTTADLVLANNAYNNYVFVGDVVVDAESKVPTTSESFAMGIAKNSGGRDVLCQDHYGQLLLEPDVAAAPRRVFITHV